MIILELDLNICRDRITNRRVNAFTGTITNIVEDPESLLYKRLNIHPKDKRVVIEAELTYYCEQYGAIRNYCGCTATVVNANQSERWVYECIAAIISRGSPICPPRQPCLVDKDKESMRSDNTSTSITSTITGTKI